MHRSLPEGLQILLSEDCQGQGKNLSNEQPDTSAVSFVKIMGARYLF